jgi:hypothetical protein
MRKVAFYRLGTVPLHRLRGESIVHIRHVNIRPEPLELPSAKSPV